MEAKEFRIGNVLNHKRSGVITISALSKNTIWFENGFGAFEYAEPIPLTEEWLLKAGFEKSFKNDYWYSIRIGDKRLLISILGNIEIEKWDRTMIGFLSICEYVHQLQNLYFALTGEELQINL